ncbi:MAG: ABC transporter permease, partial [Burkholderiales bacterium]
LTAAVGAKRLDGFLLVDDALIESGRVEYRSSNVSALRAIGELQRTLTDVARSVRLERAGVNPVVVARAQIRVDLATKKISGGKTTGESTGQSFTLAYVMAIVLFLTIFLYGANVMGSVLEEKTNRVVEVLVSSLRPFQLMLGKVTGVGAVSLFQFLIWGLSAWVLVSQRRALTGGMPGAAEAGEVFQLPPVTLETAALFLAYFLGGFLLYAAMFAVVGAISSTEQEARQAQQPVTFLLMISYLSMFAMLNDPEGALAVTLSLVPFTSPIAMPVRWAAGSLPPGQLALSLALLALGIVAVTWAAARIYRVGILMTGKRPGVRELVRWVRAA